jgi:hypothetical protein
MPVKPITSTESTQWGSVGIVNEAGAWEGTWIASSTIAEDAVSMILLVGTGAYDGLSAILYEGSTDIGDGVTEAFSLDGTIFPRGSAAR